MNKTSKIKMTPKIRNILKKGKYPKIENIHKSANNSENEENPKD